MDIQQPISNTIDGTPSASQNPLLSSETNIFNPQNEQQLYNPASASDLTTPTLNYPVGTWSYLTGEGNGIFWGTDQADSLYLQVGIGNSLEFSSNGTDFYQSGLVVGQDSHISVNLGFGNDSLYIDSSLTNALNTTGAKLTFDGGEGNDSVFGPNLDTTWNITSKNAGNVGSIEFENVENLKAAANNYATFVFTPEGSLDGIADGGDGNLGTLVIDGGTYNNAQFIAYSPHSGIIHLDDKTIEYAGLAPIFDTSVTADRVFTATEGDDQILVSKVATGQTRIFSSNNTFENITFWNPSNSLTIKGLAGNDIITIDSLDANFTKSLVIEGNDGNDQVNFEQDLTLNGGNLTVDAESIFVKTGVTIDTTQPGGIDGTINFTASDSYTENDPLRLFDSLSLELLELKKMNLTRAVQINLTGATIKAGDINMSVSSSLTGQVEDYILAQLDLTSNATISVIDSRIESSGNVTLSSSSVVKGEILAAGQAVIGYAILLAQGLWDAGNATSNINSSAIAHISGKSSLDAKGDLSITSTNEVDVTTEGLARPISLLDGAELGGGIAVARITNTTQAYIDISDNQSISAANIALLADSKNEIETRGKSATLGVTRNNDPVSELTEGQTTAVLNRFGLDWFDRAGALAFTKLNSQTQAYISADDVDNPSSINTTGKLTINANTNNNIKSEADSTFTVTQIPVVFASDSIAGNLVDIETSAYISGNTSIHAGGIDITAITDGTINSTAFGSSSADSNFAINTIQASTIAAITNTATIQVGDDNTLSMRAEDKTTIESFSLGAVISDKFLQENKTNIAVGIANARNQIDNTIKAYIGSSTVSSSSDNNVNITIEALSSNTITSESLAVALGASTSAKSLSAGGALSNNFIRTKTNAYISYSTLTDNIGDVTITANNNANINATVVATAASVGSGLAGGIGAAVANNYIGYDNDDNNTRNPAEVQAYIQNSRITSDGNLTLNAESSGSITAGVGAGSVAVAIPSLPDPKKPKAKFGEAFAISGSGVFTENQIATLVKAFVDSDGTTSIQTKSAIISAQDSSIIKADAGAASLAASAAATTGGSLAIGVALASNLISNEVEAYISNINSNTDINPDKSFKTTTGNISLSATSNGTIEAISVAASLAAGFGTTGIALSGAGGESKNTILTKTNAYISNSVVDSANGVSLTATNSANIDATIAAVSASAGGGGATGVGVAIGAAVANNYIGYEGDSRDPLEPEAYWRNSTRNPIQVQAYLQNSSVTATGDLTLSAVANNNINAGVGAGAMAVAAGGAGGGSGSGSGVNTVNKIATLVKAFVDGYGTTGIQTKSAIISAQDSSTIKADAGAASLAASFAGATGGSLAIGVALASNLISNEVEAYISNANSNTDSNTDKSFKTTTGDISLSATTDATIEAISVAASLAAGFGGAAGIALSGAGAESKNTILTKTNAYISNSVVDSASGVSLTAENSANIDATIAAVSASAGGGAATGVGVAIGAAVANNFIGYDGDTRNPAQVQAYLQNSSVTATGDLTLSAVANSNINAGVGAGAMAVAAGGAGGGSGSGSGVNTVNKVGTLVKAFVDGDRTTGIQTKSAIISAQDSSTIKADAGAASLAASFAGAVGVSLSIGVALADNLISNEVEAYINNADNSFKTTTGNISLSATTDATIEAVSVAASLAAGFGVAAGIALSGAGAESKNTILGKTNAYISNSVLDSASGVSLTAANSANIDAKIAATSASAGGGAAGVGVAIGAAIANNFIGYEGDTHNPAQVQAYLQNSSVMATGDLTLSAVANGNINAGVGAGAMAIAAGVGGGSGSGSGVNTVNKVGTLVKAFIDGDRTTGISAANISLTANDTSTITADAASVAVAATFALGGAATVGVSLAKNEIANDVQAFIRNITHSFTTTTGNIQLTATETASITTSSVAASVAGGIVGLSGAGAEALNNINNSTRSYISASKPITAQGNVTLTSWDSSNIQALAGQVSGGTTAAVGESIAINNIGNQIIAEINSSTVTATTGDVTLNASSKNANSQEANIKSFSVSGSLAPGFSGAGAVTVNNIANVIQANIVNDSNVQASGNINLTAQEDAKIESFAGAVSLSIVASDGASSATNNISSQIIAEVNKSTLTTSTGAVNLNAIATGIIDSTAAGGIGAGLFAYGGAITENNLSNTVRANVANDAKINAQGDVNLSAKNTATIQASAGQVATAGGAAFGASVAVNNSANTTQTYISDSNVTSIAGYVGVIAENTGTIKSESAGAAVADGVALTGSVSVNNITNTTESYVKNTTISGFNGVEIAAKDESTIKSLAGQISVGISGAGVGAAAAYNNIGNVVKAYVTADDGKVTNIHTSGNAIVSALDKGTIETIAVGGSGGAVVGAAGSVAVNQMSNNVYAFVHKSNIKAQGSVGILADATHSIITEGGTLSGGLLGIGGTMAVNDFKNTTSAYVNNSAIDGVGKQSITIPQTDGTGTTQSLFGVAVLATSQDNLDVTIGTTSIGGFAFVGSIAVNSFENQTQAYVKDVAINATIGSTIPEQSVYIKAFNDSTVNVNAGTAGVGGNAVGVGIDITTMKNATTAYIDSSDLIFSQGSIVNANKDLIVEAKTQQSLTSDVVAWGGGLGFSVQGAVSIINVSSDMSGDAITAISDTLSIVAEQLKELDNMGKDSNGESNITTNKNISNSRAFSSTDGSTIDLKNHGFTDGEAVVYELVGDGTDTSGLNNQQTYYVKVIDENSFQLSATKDGAAITLSQAGDEQQQFLKPESTLPSLTGTTAFIAGTASARSNLIVNAHETTKLNASVTGASVGAIGAGAAIAIADITHNAKAYVDAISRVNAANTTIQSTGFVDSTKLTAQAGAAGGAALGAAVAYLTSDNNSTAYIGENTTVNRNGQAQVVNVIADSISRLETDAQGASVGAAAVGVVLTKAEETGATSAYLDQGVQVQQTNNLNITANVDQLVKATGLAAGGGIISGNGVDVQVNVNPQINVYIGENNLINVAQDVNVISNVILDGDAAAEGDNYGGLAVGLAFSEVNSQPTINTYVGANTIIEAGNVTVESRAGVPIAIADTNIDPSLAVDNTARTITFSNEHNLQTGNQVIYSNGGGDDIGGISNDRTYNVIAVDSTTVKLGSEFQGTAVDEQANTIRFNQNHNLRNGDKVIYEAANGTAIGGLVSGNPYYVKVLDNKTVQLAETQFVVSFTYSSDNDNNQITQEGHGFNTGDRVVYQTSRQALIGLESNKAYYVIKVDANNFRLASTLSNAQAGTALDIGSNDHQHQLFLAPSQAVNLAGINTAITINNHGFQNGDLVIYQRRTAEFRIVEELPANIPPASNNFNKNTDLISNDTFTSANHGFQTGDQVIYTTSGTALGNLTNNTTYYVIRVDSDRFQLSTTENGAAIDITTAPKNSIHQITAVGLQGLQEGISYYVVNSSQNSFQLAATKDGAALTLDKSGLTGTGSVHLFNKQSLVDLTASNTDQHNLHLDLNNSTATGTNHQLITTASITIPSQGDGKFSAYAEGAVGALVGGNGTQATLNISPTVTTYIASGASITTTGNVTIKSLSVAEVTSSTDSDVLGAVAVGDSRIDANVTNTNKTDIHASAQINAQGNVSITSQSDHTFNISGYGAAGSLITFADAEAHATLTHNTQTSINDSASIIAGNELLVASSSNTNGNVKAKADGVGLYGDADAETTFRVNGTNQTNINSNAALEARKLTVAATVDNLKVHARGEATGGGFIGNIDAHATVDLADTKAVVNLNANSSLIGDFVNLSATYQNVNSNSTTSATCFAFGGDTDSAVTNNIPLAATVWTDSASQIQAYKLDVESDFANLNYKSHAYSERYFLDIGSDSTDNNFEPTPTIDFNSQVTLVAREANPILIVDQAGQIHQQSDNVTATITDTDVIVDDINNSNIGAVNFIIPDRSSEMASNGKFVDRGVYTISDPAYSTVQIDNYSAKNLIINHINVVKSGVVPQINYNVNVDDTNIAPTIPTLQLPLDINPTVVTINNWGTSNLILQGVIDNPHDRTILYSGGNIFSQGATQEIISRDLKMKAVNGSIGTSEQRVAAQLIQGYNPVTADVPASNIYLHVQASHSNYLDLTAKSYDSNPVTVDVKQMTASKGEVNIKIGQTTNQNDTAISALYKFTDTLDNNQSIKTGSNIVIDADTTTTNIDTKNIFFGTSNLLNITTGGWIKANNTASAKVNIQQAVSHQDTVTISGVDMFIVNDALVKATDVNLTAISLSILDNAQVQASNNVNLLVGNNFQINEFATITATNNVIIRGDYNNPSLIGTTFTVDGLISAQSLGIYGGRNKNTFNIKQLAATTTINTGGGDDTVNIGSSHTGYTGLNKIQGSLSIYGDTTANNSILNIDNSQDTSSRSGVLTDTNLTGLGMAHGIYYNGFKFLNIKLGKGTNNFTILNTNATTNIDGSASANNNFRIGPNLDTNGNVLNETVNGNIISGSNILGTKNPTTITTGNGNNSFQINRNQGTLKVQGRGNNNFVVSTPINSSRLLPNGVVDLTQTSGNVTIKKSALQETVVNNGSSINVVNSRLILLPPNSNPIINPGSTGTTNVNPFDLSILGRRSTAYSPVNISPIISLSSLATRSSSSSGTNTSASSGSLLLGLSVR